MITRQSVYDTMPKANKKNGALGLGVLAVFLAIPTLLFMWLGKKESNDKKEVYY